MRTSQLLAVAGLTAAAFVSPVLAVEPDPTEPVDLDMVTRIRHEGLHRSQVMDILRGLTEEIGPRLTGSPAMLRANEWTLERLREWGLENGRLEPFDFGRGWSFEHCEVHMLTPHRRPLVAYPEAWTPGTPGRVEGRVVLMEVEEAEDLEEFRGQLEGAIVFMDETRAVDPDDTPRFARYTPEELAELRTFPIPDGKPSEWRTRYKKTLELRKTLTTFLAEEGVLAAVQISSRDHGIVRVMGGNRPDADDPDGVCGLRMAAEHYNAVLRALEQAKDSGQEVRLAIDVRARFHEDDRNAYNTLADLRGRGKSRELVMVGAHLDSWHAGTGATDNAAGCAVVMEAVRILQAVGAELDRTVRVALWSGEEQGLLGARAHVEQRFATRPAPTDSAQLALPRSLRETTWPIETLDDHGRLSAYFNIDNGAGRIRGIYAEENAAAAAIFARWLQPFHDLGAETVTLQTTGGTDHRAFQAVGLPGFQFVQDELDYFPRTHHTHIDTIDHVIEDDLKVSAVIMASFLYHAATRDELLPRKPMPQPPPEDAEKANGRVAASD